MLRLQNVIFNENQSFPYLPYNKKPNKFINPKKLHILLETLNRMILKVAKQIRN
jgi:hypothetical protein